MHDRDPPARISTTARSWRDEQAGEALLRCSSWNSSSTLACTETSSAEVGSSAISSFGSQRERPGDADPLPLAAGQLVRVAVAHRPGQLHPVQQVLHPLAQLGALGLAVQQQRLADRLADRQPRDSATSPGPGTRSRRPCGIGCSSLGLALTSMSTTDDARRALDDRQQPDQGAADGGLAGAGLADQAHHLAPAELQVDVVDRPEGGRPPALGVLDGDVVSSTIGSTPAGDHRLDDPPFRRGGDRRPGRRPRPARRQPRPAGQVSSSSALVAEPRCGTAPAAAPCTDRCGPVEDLVGGAGSTIRPSFITTTRSAMSATTPMSWVISTMARRSGA